MSFCIFKADLEKNRDDILVFWKRNFPTWPEKKLTWFYRNNPCGRAACWIIKDAETDMVAGSTAIFPRKVLVNGELLLGGIAGDFAVDTKHRILGPALQLQKAGVSACNEKQFDFLYAYPNEKSEPVQRRAGFKVVGSTFRMVKILRSKNYIKSHIDLPIVAKLVSKAVDLILKVLSKESYYKKRRGFRFEVLSVFDKRFDDLWEKASSHYSIIGERTSEFLNWRFTQCPYKKYSIFAMIKKGSKEIIGYIVYHVVRHNVNIADLLVADMNKYIDALVPEFLLFQRKNPINTVSIILFGNEDLMNKLKQYRFSVREDVRNVVVYTPTNSPFSPYLLDKTKWHLMEGDND